MAEAFRSARGSEGDGFDVQRMAENDAIVTRYMADESFQSGIVSALAREIFEAVHRRKRELTQSR